MKDAKTDFDTYAICDLCAHLNDLHAFKTGNTVSMGKCGYCKCGREEMLTPLRDLKRPDGKRGDVYMDEVNTYE